MILEWNFSYFLIQLAGGFVGAHMAALIAHEQRFGFIGHSLVGIMIGALGGLFFQRIVMTTVTAAGDVMPIDGIEAIIYQAVAGLVGGSMGMLAVGFCRYELAKGDRSR